MTKLFPWTIAIPVFVLTLVEFSRDLFRGNNAQSGQIMDFQFAEGIEPGLARRRMFGILCWIVGLLGAVWLFGMEISMTIMTFAYLKLQGKERWPITLVLTAIAWLFLRGVFIELMQLPFPEGILFEALPGAG